MIFRLYHETRGGHVHCRLFAGAHDGALGKCGEFTMRLDEFEHFAWLVRSRFEFMPEVGFHDIPSANANGLANRILDQIRMRLTPDEYRQVYGMVTVALDDSFDLGVIAAGGAVIDDAPPRPYRRSDMPPIPLAASEIAADWFTLPPKMKTKARLLEMLERNGEYR